MQVVAGSIPARPARKSRLYVTGQQLMVERAKKGFFFEMALEFFEGWTRNRELLLAFLRAVRASFHASIAVASYLRYESALRTQIWSA
jgi:hypothetical protein